MKMGLSPVNVS